MTGSAHPKTTHFLWEKKVGQRKPVGKRLNAAEAASLGPWYASKKQDKENQY